MTKLEKIQNMLELQDKFNSSVNLEWKKAGYNWKTAIFVETAEAIDSLGYKWWKHQEPDLENFKVELVDIWHFLMSYMMVQEIPKLDEKILDKFNNKNIIINSIESLMMFNSNILSNYSEDSSLNFIHILTNNGLDIDSLFNDYIVKNCLNKFRQDFGYKQGTYKKIWNYQGREVEDNVVAYSLVKENNSFDLLYEALKKEYIK